jgi:hypothetical protein
VSPLGRLIQSGVDVIQLKVHGSMVLVVMENVMILRICRVNPHALRALHLKVFRSVSDRALTPEGNWIIESSYSVIQKICRRCVQRRYVRRGSIVKEKLL